MHSTSKQQRLRGQLALMAVTLGGLVIWLIVLPWVGDQPIVRAHVDRLQAADVNASAMFYTELDCKYLIGR